MRIDRPLLAAACSLFVLLTGCGSPPPPVEPAVLRVPTQPTTPAAPATRAARPMHLLDAAARCSSMPRAARPGLELSGTQLIAQGVAHPVEPVSRSIAGAALPEHCRIEGRLRPQANDGVAPRVSFEMRLPSRWNGRFLHQGSFDLESRTVEAFGRTTGAGGLEDNALSQGFAVLASNAARSPSVLPAAAATDGSEAEAALARVVLAAKVLIHDYYGKPADRSYFVGCSEGGKEGLLFAQRWPEAFDGIVAVAPLLRKGDAALAAAWTLRHFTAAAPRVRSKPRTLSEAFSIEELFVVANGILKQCDAIDGAEDGFVMDMAGCRFDPATVQCKRRGAKSCLSKAKVQALAAAMGGPRDAAGKALYAPWPWDPGIAAPGWRAWTLGTAAPGDTPNPELLSLTSQMLSGGLEGLPTAKSDARAFDRSRATASQRARREAEAVFMTAPLEDFRQRDGKLLLVHGAADPVVSAWVTIDYQRQLDRAHPRPGAPGAADFARTFIVPGMNHCAGGPSLDRFDALAALVEWVETEKPPERIEARGSAALRDETRPLCPWPEVARYRGAGSVQVSASYECR